MTLAQQVKPAEVYAAQEREKQRLTGELLKAKEIYAIVLSNKAEDPEGYGRASLAMASCLLALGEKKQAYDYYHKALETYSEMPLDDKASDLGGQLWFFLKNYLAGVKTRDEEKSVLDSLFSAYEKKKDYRCVLGEFDAASMYERRRPEDGLAIMNRMCAYLIKSNPKDIETITQYVRLTSDMYQRIHELNKIEPLDRQVLALAEQQYGSLSIELIDPLVNLAHFCIFENSDSEAAQLADRVLGIAAFAKDVFTLDKLAVIGNAYIDTGKLDRAEAFLRNAISIKAKLFKKEQPTQLDNSIMALEQKYVEAKRFEDAEAILKCWLVAQDAGSDGQSRVLQSLTYLHCEHAGYLKHIGKIPQSNAQLKQFNETFEEELINVRQRDKNVVPEYLISRERMLKQFELEIDPGEIPVNPPVKNESPVEASPQARLPEPSREQRQIQVAEYVKELSRARLRTEVDPFSHIDYAIRLAGMRAQVGEKQQAVALFREAVSTYSQVSLKASTDDVVGSFWHFISMATLRNELTGQEGVLVTALLDAAEKRKDYYCLEQGASASESLESRVNGAISHSILNRVTQFLLRSKTDNLDLLSNTALRLAKVNRRAKSHENIQGTARQVLTLVNARLGKGDTFGAETLANLSALFVLADIHPDAEHLASMALNAAANQSSADMLDKLSAILEAYTDMGSLQSSARVALEICKVKESRFNSEDLAYTDGAMRMLSYQLCQSGDFVTAQRVSEGWLHAQAAGSGTREAVWQDLLPVYAGRAGQLRKQGKAAESKAYLAKFKKTYELCARTYQKPELVKELPAFKAGCEQMLKPYGMSFTDL